MPAYKDGKKWSARFYYSNSQGERKQKHKRGFQTKREALEWEREFLREEQFSDEMKFSTLYNIYIKDLGARLKESTMRSKKNLFETRILPFFQNIPINEITPGVIRKWQTEMLNSEGRNGKPYSYHYLRGMDLQLIAIFRYAERYYNLKENPYNKAERFKSNKKHEMKYWTLEEFNEFLEYVKHKPVSYTGFNMLFWTGMRIGELLALEVRDIDLKNRSIRVNKTYHRHNGREYVTEPKTPKSNRIISIPKVLMEVLEDYLGRLYEPEPEQRLFNCTNSLFRSDLNRYCDYGNLKKIRLHDLRHSHASLLINANVSPIAISERLGHEKVETTLNTYSHLYPSTRDKVLDLLDSLPGNKMVIKK